MFAMNYEELIYTAINHYKTMSGLSEVSADASSVTTLNVQLRTPNGELVIEYDRSEILKKRAIKKYSKSATVNKIPSESSSFVSRDTVHIRDEKGLPLAVYELCQIGESLRILETENKSTRSDLEYPQPIDDKQRRQDNPNLGTNNLDLKDGRTSMLPRRKIAAVSTFGFLMAIVAVSVFTSQSKTPKTSNQRGEDIPVEYSSMLEIVATSEPVNQSTWLVRGHHNNPALIILSFARTKKTALANAEMKCMDRLNAPSTDCTYEEINRGYLAIAEGSKGAGMTAGVETMQEAVTSANAMCKKMSKEKGASGDDCNIIFKYQF